VPTVSSADRVRNAWQRRNETDYIFHFWTAFGWFVLTLGIYGIYIIYRLFRRARDHNARRIELLDASAAFAWEQAQARGMADELRPAFERISPHMATLRSYGNEFRDPAVWAIIDGVAHVISFGSVVVSMIAFILIDGDLVRHDYAEGAIEHELSQIYARLGATVTPPDANRLKGQHSYVGRIFATVFTLGIYMAWWAYDIMTETNRHYEECWRWEDSVAQGVQQLLTVR
jgi:hypothetical protein